MKKLAAIKSTIDIINQEESLNWTDENIEDIGLLDDYQDSTDRVTRNLQMLKLAVELFKDVKINENERKITVNFNKDIKSDDIKMNDFIEILSDITNCDVEQIGNEGKEVILF